MKKWIICYGLEYGKLDYECTEEEIEIEEEMFNILVKILKNEYSAKMEVITIEEQELVDDYFNELYNSYYEEEKENYIEYNSYGCDEDYKNELVSDFEEIFRFEYLCESNLELHNIEVDED